MQNYKPLYLWSLEDAIRNNEKELWRESYKENCDCARTIERAITDAYNYGKSCLDACAKPVIEQYGFDRVNWVLANTVQQKNEDGRFSQENKAWANITRLQIHSALNVKSAVITAVSILTICRPNQKQSS